MLTRVPVANGQGTSNVRGQIEGEMSGETIEIGIVGPPADHLLGYEGVEGAQGPRFRKLSPQEVDDYLTNL